MGLHAQIEQNTNYMCECSKQHEVNEAQNFPTTCVYVYGGQP
jgi:hypothetical protein